MAASTRVRRVNFPVVVLGAVLAVLGFSVAMLLGNSRVGPVAGTSTSTAVVVVAARDLPARAPIGKDSLRAVSLPVSAVPPGALGRVEEGVGTVPLVEIRAGQPLYQNLLTRTPEGVNAAPQPYLQLAKGFVAFALPAGEQQAVAGYIQPGDRIDLVAVVAPRGGGNASVRTIYTNVPVLRIGPAPDDAAARGAAVRKSGVSTSITVAVNQCQAEYLAWFATNATLRFTLLASADYRDRGDLTSDETPCGAAKVVNDTDIKARWPGLL